MFDRLVADPRVSRLAATCFRFDEECERYLVGGKVENYQLDITDRYAVERVFQKSRPEAVFHLAGKAQVRDGQNNPIEMAEANTMGTLNLLAACKPGTRFVFASSSTVYGNWCDDEQYPTDETDELWPNSVYGASKAASEMFIRAFDESKGVEAQTFRLVANVGANATHGLIPDLVRKLQSDSPVLELFGNQPGSIKPYMHVSDTVRFLSEFGLSRTFFGNVLNLAPNDSLSVEQIAEIAMDELGIRKPIHWLGKQSVWPGDNPYVYLDNTSLRTYFPKVRSSAEAVRLAVFDITKQIKGAA